VINEIKNSFAWGSSMTIYVRDGILERRFALEQTQVWHVI
jgi:hypothetical protein